MYDYIGSGFVLPRITLFMNNRKRKLNKEVILNYSLNKEFLIYQ